MEYYKLNVAGCERHLPICKINENTKIAAFIMFGDVEITEKCAKLLLEKVSDFDVLITAEAKGIPLCYEMAKQCGKKYLVARKSIKLYMNDPVCVQVKSITTEHPQKLYLSRDDFNFLQGKRVLIVDDVISTGKSLEAMEMLIDSAKGIVAGRAAVFAEGDAAHRDDIVFLDTLPLI